MIARDTLEFLGECGQFYNESAYGLRTNLKFLV